MKGIIASILIVLAGVFGAHGTPSATTALHSSSTSSSVAARTPASGLTKTETTLNIPLLAATGVRLARVPAQQPTTSGQSSASSVLPQAPRPGLVLGTSTVAATDLVTQEQLQTAVNALRSQLFAVSSTPSFSGPPATTAVTPRRWRSPTRSTPFPASPSRMRRSTAPRFQIFRLGIYR